MHKEAAVIYVVTYEVKGGAYIARWAFTDVEEAITLHNRHTCENPTITILGA